MPVNSEWQKVKKKCHLSGKWWSDLVVQRYPELGVSLTCGRARRRSGLQCSGRNCVGCPGGCSLQTTDKQTSPEHIRLHFITVLTISKETRSKNMQHFCSIRFRTRIKKPTLLITVIYRRDTHFMFSYFFLCSCTRYTTSVTLSSTWMHLSTQGSWAKMFKITALIKRFFCISIPQSSLSVFSPPSWVSTHLKINYKVKWMGQLISLLMQVSHEERKSFFIICRRKLLLRSICSMLPGKKLRRTLFKDELNWR